jgi:hypothetical protein
MNMGSVYLITLEMRDDNHDAGGAVTTYTGRDPVVAAAAATPATAVIATEAAGSAAAKVPAASTAAAALANLVDVGSRPVAPISSGDTS